MIGRSMGVWRMIIVIIFAFPSLVRSSSDSPLPDITDEKFIEECVRSHNLNRSNANPTAGNMLYMSWDAALAITARAWAKNCVFKHNIYLHGKVKKVHPTFKSLGENLWSGYPVSSFSVGKAMQSWVDKELKDYQYDLNTCTGQACGHYTQVVWATSYKVGCAVHRCPDGVEGFAKGIESAHFVCNYYPPGNQANFRGVSEKPYVQGRPCIRCAGDTCEHSLCRNPTRDAAIHYKYWRPEWEESPETSGYGSFFKAVLILRPLAVLLIFAAAYVIKMQCPNIFVYE